MTDDSFDDAPRSDEEADTRSCLVDVTQVPLRDLIETDSSVLANALRRVRAELAGSEDVVAGHSDSVQ